MLKNILNITKIKTVVIIYFSHGKNIQRIHLTEPILLKET